LDHPFEKVAPWAFTARLFLVIKWNSAIEMPGEWFSWTRETGGYGQQTIREDMHRQQQKPATDLFSHELSAGWTWSTSWTFTHLLLLQAAQW